MALLEKQTVNLRRYHLNEKYPLARRRAIIRPADHRGRNSSGRLHCPNAKLKMGFSTDPCVGHGRQFFS
jgi:hypothetical protein